VNPNTIARSYRELETIGVVEKRRTAGTFVSAEGSPLARKERTKILTQRVDQLLAEAKQMGLSLDDVVKLIHQRDANFGNKSAKKESVSHERIANLRDSTCG
jgi:GntR family transcriptional regulator